MMRLTRVLPYAINGYKEVITDRGLLIVDFVLATSIPYVIQYVIWFWIYNTAPQSLSFSFLNIMMYYAYVIAFNRLNNGYSIIELTSIRFHNGSIASYLCKPVSFPLQVFSEFLGGSVIYTIPVFLIHIIQLFIQQNFVYFFQTLGLSILIIIVSQTLCFMLSFLLAQFIPIIYKDNFLLSLLLFLQVVLGGVMLPYYLWPSWMQGIMRYNPFRFITAAPAELLSGLPNSSLSEYFILSGFYIVLCYFSIVVIWGRLVRNTKILGG